MSTPGVDVSNNQGVIDWAAVRASGRLFAAIKASGDETASGVYLDRYFPENWHTSRAQGMARIAYHYAKPSRVPPSQSVGTLQRALAAVGGLQPGDNVALDIEDPDVPDGQSLHQWVAEWLDLAARAFGVPTPWKYSAHYYTSTHDLEHDDLGGYPTWWAAYQATQPPASRGWGPIWIWQHDAHGTVPGVAGPCDLDVFNGTFDELRALGLPAPTAFDRTAEQDALWATAERWEQAGYPWMGAGIKALTAKDKGEP